MPAGKLADIDRQGSTSPECADATPPIIIKVS